MYSILIQQIDDYNTVEVDLKYQSDLVSITFTPDTADTLIQVSEEGEIGGLLSNGKAIFKWNKDVAYFTIKASEKYQGCYGGEVTIVIKHDEKSFESLMSALQEWKDAIDCFY